MERDNAILTFLAGFFCAITIASFAVLPFSLALLLCLCGTFLLILSRKGFRIVLFAFFLIGFGVGSARYAWVLAERLPAKNLLVDTGGVLRATGVVSAEPDEEEDGTRLTVTLDHDFGKLYLLTSSFPRFAYGDRVSLAGKPTLATSKETGELTPIHDDTFYVLSRPTVELVSHGNGSRLFTFLYEIKRRFLEALASVIPEPYATFGGGIVIGAKQGLSKSLVADFQRTSTSHLIAVSGYNLTIVADVVYQLVSFFSVVFAPLASVIAVLLFTLLTGAAGSTLRAATMSFIVVYGKQRGKNTHMFRTLLVAAFVLAFWNPRILFFDLSFELSFLATIGIVYVAPLLEPRLKQWGVPSFFAELISGTLAAEMLVLPLVLYSFGQLSLVGPLANIFVLPPVPLLMALLFVTGFLGMTSSFLGAPFALVAYLLLRYELGVIHFFASLPFSSVLFENVPVVIPVVVYFLIFVWVYRSQVRTRDGEDRGVIPENDGYEIVDDDAELVL